MKASFLLLSFVSSLAIAQSLVADECQCPQVKCRATNAFESCRCINKAELACKKKCPGYISTKWRKCTLEQQESTVASSDLALPTDPILGFPLPALPVPKPTPLVLPMPDLPQVPGCECEETMCIMSFPEGCHCQWGVKKACYDKCGGTSPGINTCPKPLPAPVPPKPLPSPLVLPLPDMPLIPGCQCEQMMCIQSFPESCHCEWGIRKSCYDKCGGVSPGINTCSATSDDIFSDGPVRRAAAPEPQTINGALGVTVNVPKIVSVVAGALTPVTCVVEELLCALQWPQSCYCANANKFVRYQKCGGSPPVYQSCGDAALITTVTTTVTKTVTKTVAPILPSIPKPTVINTLPPTSKPVVTNTLPPTSKPAVINIPPPIPKPTVTTPKPSVTSSLPSTPIPTRVKVQACGGFRVSNVPCPSGYKCVDDPYVAGSCGLACDRPGICVSIKLCGGFAGFRCPEAGQVCLDDPNDDCDPKNGGADCGGLCFWPPSLRLPA